MKERNIIIICKIFPDSIKLSLMDESDKSLSVVYGEFQTVVT